MTYHANRRAWMSSELFIDWLKKINNKMVPPKCKILMFVDNCFAQPTVDLSNVKQPFLHPPPNTTSHIESRDPGIIRPLKADYRRRILNHILHHMSEVANVSELAKKVTVLDVILRTRRARGEVTPGDDSEVLLALRIW